VQVVPAVPAVLVEWVVAPSRTKFVSHRIIDERQLYSGAKKVEAMDGHRTGISVSERFLRSA